jgi:hypothetical protein
VKVNGINTRKAKELYQAGYTSVDDLKSAQRTELSTFVGNVLTSSIKSDVEESDASDTSSGSPALPSQHRNSTREGGNTQEPTQPDNDEDIEQLLELPDINKKQAEALHQEGYTNQGELRTAASSDIADIVGHETMVSIRDAIGFVSENSHITDTHSRSHASRQSSSGGQPEANQASEVYSDFIWKSDTTDTEVDSNSASSDSEETDPQLETDRQTVTTLLSDAMSDPFRDPDSTREQLIRCHKETAELAERAQATNAEDILSFAESTLNNIEHRLEMLSDISESIRSARSRVSTDELPSDSIGLTDLESARDSYTTAVESANETEFDTARLEQERAEIISAIENKTEDPEIADSASTEESKPDDVSDVSDESPTRDELINELTHLDETVEGYPLTTDLREGGKYTQNDYIAEFGSWEDALNAANINKKQRLIDEIHRVKDIVDGKPNTTDMNEYGTHSSGTYSTTFGSWDAALEAAGIDEESDSENHTQTVQPNQQDGTGTSTDSNDSATESNTAKQEYISAIQEFAQTTDDVIKSTDFKDYSGYSVQTIGATFGSWQDALEAADVDNKSRLINELRRVGEKVGHQPSTTEVNRHGTVSATLYSDYFESYTEAKQQAFSDQNDLNDGSDTAVSEQNFARISDVTEDGRLSDPIALKVCYELDDTSEKKDASLDVEDFDGNQCWLHIWRTHDIDMAWEKDQWYVLTDPRGKQWTDKNDEIKRQLSSTKDLQVTHVGDSPPTETNAMDSTSDPTPTQSDESQEPTDTDTDSGDDADDILNEIMTEFEDISED